MEAHGNQQVLQNCYDNYWGWVIAVGFLTAFPYSEIICMLGLNWVGHLISPVIRPELHLRWSGVHWLHWLHPSIGHVCCNDSQIPDHSLQDLTPTHLGNTAWWLVPSGNKEPGQQLSNLIELLPVLHHHKCFEMLKKNQNNLTILQCLSNWSI